MQQIVRSLSYSVAYAEASESARRNYRGRVALGFFLLAFIGFVTALHGDLPENIAYIWISCVLVAYPVTWLVEGLIEVKMDIPEGAEQQQVSMVGEVDGTDETESSQVSAGTVEHYIQVQDSSSLHVLHDLETPNGSFNYLLVHRDGRVLMILRSSCWNALGEDNLGDWKTVRVEAEGLLEDAERVDAVLDSIQGGHCKVYPVLIVPEGSLSVAREGPTFRISLVSENNFCDFMDKLPPEAEGNEVVFDYYDKLRAIIKG